MTKEEQKHLYEGMYILSATLSDEARQKALDKLLSGISDKAGEIHKVHEMGRRKFAYEIDGRREGYYYVIFFSLPSLKMKDLWKEYHLNEDLLRFSTLTVEEVQESLEFKQLLEQ